MIAPTDHFYDTLRGTLFPVALFLYFFQQLTLTNPGSFGILYLGNFTKNT